MKIAVVGGGPAGLRAAEVAVGEGASVTVFDANPSVGRKFLVAGRGGLNLTNTESLERFVRSCLGPGQPEGVWCSMLTEFGPEALQAWASELGIDTFAASSGRVYPRGMKAAPLLRRWLEKLRALGVEFAVRHRWTGVRVEGDSLGFSFVSDGRTLEREADAGILALGGASWPQTGSDGGWVDILSEAGISVSPLQPANCGWDVPWTKEVLLAAEGLPLKNIAARAGGEEAVGELLITRDGLEGGAIYQLGPTLRRQAVPILSIDLKPASSCGRLVEKLGPIRRNLIAEASSRWRLSSASAAILAFAAQAQPPASPAEVAALCKDCRIRLGSPRPLPEAISSAGGVRWSELNDRLMLNKIPGLFVAGEMIDWEAPTGGYLIQGCFATGTRAGRSAAAWSASH